MAQQEKPIYLLVHNHKFGADVHTFKSDNYYCGYYNYENNNQSEIQYIIDKLDLDVDFENNMDESIEIIGFEPPIDID